MRLATVHTADETATEAVLLHPNGGAVPLGAPDLGAFFERTDWREVAESVAATPVHAVAEVGRFAAPVHRPGKIICVGLNYIDHIVETGRDEPDFPTLFAKFPDSVAGPTDEIEVIGSAEVDWEAELVVVVGATLTRANAHEAEAAIAGYTIANDISMRDWQHRTLQWMQGKAWTAATPMGPVVVTPDEFDPASDVRVTTEVNGEQLQDGNPGALVFGPVDLLAYISQFTTLRPGDLVLTGTPGGVGSARSPKRFLADGDELVTTITGIGELRNRMRIRER